MEQKTIKTKKKYCKPEIHVEVFTPNEYVSTCYKVYCDCPYGYELWKETNGQDGLQRTGKNKDTKVYSSNRSFHGCYKWHGGVEVDPQKNGYVVTNEWGPNVSYQEVFVWEESLGSSSDWHASTLSSNPISNPNAS